MGTSKVVVRRTATRKDGNSKGTVKTSTKVQTNGTKVKVIKSRKADVNRVKGS